MQWHHGTCFTQPVNWAKRQQNGNVTRAVDNIAEHTVNDTHLSILHLMNDAPVNHSF